MRTQLNSRKIMDGVPAKADQIHDSTKSALASWNSGCNIRLQAKLVESHNVREIERLKLGIVRNVEKNCLGIKG